MNVDPYDAANIKYRYNNLADMVAIRFDLNKQIADMIEPIIASRTAREWEQAMANAQPYPLPVTLVMTQQEWMQDDHARRSGLVTAVRGTDDFQFGRMIWLDSAQPYPDLTVGRRAATLPPRTKPVPTPHRTADRAGARSKASRCSTSAMSSPRRRASGCWRNWAPT